jgi:P-type E1-E2 ATPase
VNIPAVQYDIFARTSPEHKLRLVKALQGKGEIVGMTGDGVNDAPALRQADVGIAMGIKGTEVTKEAADMVLTDDNFATIASSVKEGRRVYDNLKKTILFIMPTNLAQGLLIIIALLAGNIIPLTPVLILFYFCADPHNQPIDHPKVTVFTDLAQLPALWKARGWKITR